MKHTILLIIISIYSIVSLAQMTATKVNCQFELINDIDDDIDYNYNIADLRWRTLADDDIELSDNLKSNTFDIDNISNYADVAALIIDLEAWKLSCSTTSDTSGGGTSTDTLKVPVFNAYLSNPTTADTLYKCYGVSFTWLPSSSGTVDISASNGDVITFPANSNIPYWSNTFIDWIYYDATSAVGLIVSGFNCSRVDTSPCIELQPTIDCISDTVITCMGWQTASGVWRTSSGCWQTP